MKRRLLSFFLALIMVLGLVPAASAVTTPTLGVRETEWNGSSLDVWNSFQNPMYVQYHFNKRISFFYGTENNNQLLTGITNVTAADPSILEVSQPDITPTGDHIYHFTGKALGTTTLTVDTTSGTYTMPVEVVYPAMGAYSQPVLDLNYFLEDEFAYTSTNKVLYFFSDFQLSSCTVERGYENNFDIAISSDKTHAIVTVKDFTGLDGECPRFECSGTDSYGNSRSAGSHYLTFVDGTPTIGYVDTWYDNNQLFYNDWFRKQLDLGMGNSTRLAFGYGISSNYSLLTNITDVTSADEDIVTVELRDVDGKINIWRIQSESLGSTYLNVKTDSGTYQLPVNVDLPELGIYSQPYRKADYLLARELTFTDANNSFYLIFDDGSSNTISNACVDNPAFAGNFQFTTVNSKCIRVDITNAAGLNDNWVDFRCQLADSNGNPSGYGTWGVGINFINGNPAPGYRRIEWQGNDISVSGNFESDLSFSPGGSLGMVFYYGNANSCSALDVTSVIVADPSVATVEYWRNTIEGLPTYEIRFKNPGSTEIIVDTPTGQHRIPLEVRIYAGYFFTQPVFDNQYVSSSFDITPSNDTLYFVAEPGMKIEDISPDQNFAGVFDITYAADRSYATIKVLNPTALPNYNTHFDVRLNDGRNIWTNGYGVGIYNAVPALIAEYVNVWNDQVSSTGNFMTSLDQSLYSRPALMFHYGTSANHTPITGITSVTLADPTLAEITPATSASGDQFFFLNPLKDGQTTITVQTASDTYTMPLSVQLPMVGVYSAPTLSVNTLLRYGFYWTDTNKSFYLILRDPSERIDSAFTHPDFAKTFNITVAPDGSYAKVDLVDTTGMDDAHTDFSVTVTNSYGNTYTYSVGCSIINANPTVGVRCAWWENNVFDAYGDFARTLYVRLGGTPIVPYSGSAISSNPLTNVVSVESDDPTLFHVSKPSTIPASGGDAYAIEVTNSNAAGSANLLIKTADGQTHKVPVVVLPPMAAVFDNLSDTVHNQYQFTFSDNKRDFYVKPVEAGHKITSVNLDLPAPFTVEISPNGDWARVLLDDPSQIGHSGELWMQLDIQTPYGMEWCSFYLQYTSQIAPPAVPNSPVDATGYPAWTHSGYGTPNELNEGDTIYVSVPVENKTAAALEIQAMLAIYDANGKMLALRSGTVTVPANGSDNVSLDVDLTGIYNADHAKLFMVDSDQIPVSTVFTLS